MTNSKGFTLVELVIVIAIIGILGIVAIPMYKSHMEKARISQTDTAIEQNTAEEIPLEEVLPHDITDDNMTVNDAIAINA